LESRGENTFSNKYIQTLLFSQLHNEPEVLKVR